MSEKPRFFPEIAFSRSVIQPLVRKAFFFPEEPEQNPMARYFEAPSDYYIGKLQLSPKLEYVPAVETSNPNLTPTERLIQMQLKPLADMIDRDFFGRPIALQGIACSVGQAIDYSSGVQPQSDRLYKPVVRSVWGIINPSVSDGFVGVPFYMPHRGMPLSDQSLPAFDFMRFLPDRARERAKRHKEPGVEGLIFPGMLVVDLGKVGAENVSLVPGGIFEIRHIRLSGSRRERRDAVLKLYVCDYSKIVFGAKRNRR